MSGECIFCRIIDGEIPSRTVYETDAVIAFLDANPITEGHTLIVPKTHAVEMRELPETDAAAAFGAIPRITRAVEDAVAADGSTVGFNNGEIAGQAVPHVHGHIIPRFRDDGGGSVHSVLPAQASMSDDELDEVRDRIESHM